MCHPRWEYYTFPVTCLGRDYQTELYRKEKKLLHFTSLQYFDVILYSLLYNTCLMDQGPLPSQSLITEGSYAYTKDNDQTVTCFAHKLLQQRPKLNRTLGKCCSYGHITRPEFIHCHNSTLHILCVAVFSKNYRILYGRTFSHWSKPYVNSFH